MSLGRIYFSEQDRILYPYDQHEKGSYVTQERNEHHSLKINESRSDLMVSALVFDSSGLGSSPGQGHCVVFLGKTLYSHSACLHPAV